MNLPNLASLTIADPPSAWAELGFTVADDNAHVGGVPHHLDPNNAKRGITSWELSGVSLPLGACELDGLATVVVNEPEAAAVSSHANGVMEIDHLVVATPLHARTLAAFEAAGLRLLRTRESDTYGAPMVQGFFRLGPVILEVIGSPDSSSDGPAVFFGIAFTVDDLDATARYLGARLHAPKEAVQPGRRIATLDRSAGVGTAIAFMSGPGSTGA